MRDVIAVVLAGGRVEELSVLTLVRPKAAVPFGGQYRIIDFALSNLMRADLEQVGVLSLYRPSSLIDHLGTGAPWDLLGRGRGLKILPPFTAHSGSEWYRGTADAVYQNLHFVRRYRPRDVMVLSGDHIYSMDLRPFVDQHRRTGADLTMVVKRILPDRGRSRFGFAEVDGKGRVIGYEEKPAEPRSDLVSLTIYLFRTEVLIARLEENARTGRSLQLYDEVLPAMVSSDKVFAYEHDGYWRYARSVDTYHGAHMDLLGDEPAIRLGDWGVRTRKQLRGLGDQPPARIESSAECVDAIVSPGARVAGRVRRSVLSPGVEVEAGAEVVDSVVLHDCKVRAGARVDRAVLDKGVEVGAGARIGLGSPDVPNCDIPRALASGVSLVGKAARVPEGAEVGRNCIVEPELGEGDWPAAALESGRTLRKEEGSAA
ncbi:MAG: glucose-1-phosphate adenylyltransferase [Deltaproteobacteria bacterium]|nr:glucose-1-phosphate adenylyltransferase [Deltaproteobacteria bacterium]